MPVYRAHAAPCNAGCPAGNDVVGFVQALARGGVEAAADVLLRTQPLPSVCGRVCPAPCMSACNRGDYDGAVNIRALERWIGDHVAPRGVRPAPASPRRRVAVVGGGPAGLAAAFALATAGHEVEILEGESLLGGVLRTGIPAYRLPEDVLDRDVARILSLGVAARTGAFLDAQAVRDLAASRDAVVIAAGLPRLTPLDAPGADLPGVLQGIRFLDDVKRGSPPRLSGRVVVVGGGNTAIDCARTALRLGAASVAIAYRRGRKEMPAIAPEIEEAVAEGVELLLHRQPVRVHGEGSVTGVELAEVELGEPDASGRRRPVVTGRTRTERCDAILLALGQSADRSIVPDLPNVFLAGDMATGDGTVTHAIGDGRRVAARVLAALAGEPEPVSRRPAPEDLVSPAHVRFSHFEVAPPHAERHRAAPGEGLGFEELNLGLDGPAEAARCFSCGTCTRCDTCMLYCPEGVIRPAPDGYRVDESFCKGCGMCVAECPRRAMEMVLEVRAR
jgi:NADPH-dependent glutamate synthase beta subunit-like oxidoreductase/ferredoxin